MKRLSIICIAAFLLLLVLPQESQASHWFPGKRIAQAVQQARENAQARRSGYEYSGYESGEKQYALPRLLPRLRRCGANGSCGT